MQYLVLIIALMLAGGCEPANRDELTKDVLAADPRFSAVLDTRMELAGRIETYEKELALRRKSVDENIKKLRRELREVTASIKDKIKRTKSQMDPHRERVELALSMASEQLRATRLNRASLRRSISKLKGAMKRGAETQTHKERANQQVQLDEMVLQAQQLDQQLLNLKEQVRLLKLKLLLVKL